MHVHFVETRGLCTQSCGARRTNLNNSQKVRTCFTELSMDERAGRASSSKTNKLTTTTNDLDACGLFTRCSRPRSPHPCFLSSPNGSDATRRVWEAVRARRRSVTTQNDGTGSGGGGGGDTAGPTPTGWLGDGSSEQRGSRSLSPRESVRSQTTPGTMQRLPAAFVKSQGAAARRTSWLRRRSRGGGLCGMRVGQGVMFCCAMDGPARAESGARANVSVRRRGDWAVLYDEGATAGPRCYNPKR
jgi:hypothetical protein